MSAKEQSFLRVSNARRAGNGRTPDWYSPEVGISSYC
jgi:hypothetical protein